MEALIALILLEALSIFPKFLRTRMKRNHSVALSSGVAAGQEATGMFTKSQGWGLIASSIPSLYHSVLW